MRIGLRSALAATVVTTAIVSSTAGTALAAAPASQDKPANVFVKRGQVAKFAATSTFKLNLPKGDRAVLTPRGVRFLDAKGQVIGGMPRLDVKDKDGHIHHSKWALEGNQLTQTISDVNGATIEGTVVKPTTPGRIEARIDWNCMMDGTGAVIGGLGVAGAALTSPMTAGTSLAAAGGLLGGTVSAAKGFADHCV
ncbi:hypothetical protein ACH4FX_10825 [Streptomyces sp. NPDC018019]|uniref:hypothetical protein n=1 Tax=Streptomyces sp. NPDC018019 TaxID=3365030 RepID=UPI0037BBD9A1